jgi:hypothetical protein
VIDTHRDHRDEPPGLAVLLGGHQQWDWLGYVVASLVLLVWCISADNRKFQGRW